MRTVDINEWLTNFIGSTDRITSGHGDLMWRWSDWRDDVLPTLRQIAQRLEAGENEVTVRTDRPNLSGHICLRAVGMACGVCDAKNGADRMTPIDRKYFGDARPSAGADRMTATEATLDSNTHRLSTEEFNRAYSKLNEYKRPATWTDRAIAAAREAIDEANIGRFVEPIAPMDWLAPLGLAGGTATATAAAKVDSPEPCICPPGGVSRSCRAVGFRSGIMHKDRE